MRWLQFVTTQMKLPLSWSLPLTIDLNVHQRRDSLSEFSGARWKHCLGEGMEVAPASHKLVRGSILMGRGGQKPLPGPKEISTDAQILTKPAFDAFQLHQQTKGSYCWKKVRQKPGRGTVESSFLSLDYSIVLFLGQIHQNNSSCCSSPHFFSPPSFPA